MKRSVNYIAAVIAIMLVVLLTSCQSSPETVVKTETKLPPAVHFPDPPDPTGHVEYKDNGDVIVSNAYWLSLAEYMIDVEATEKKYKAIRKEYELDDRDKS